MCKFTWENFIISSFAFFIVFALFRWYATDSYIPIAECNAQKTEYFNRINQEVFDRITDYKDEKDNGETTSKD